jgi:hypothetical protein
VLEDEYVLTIQSGQRVLRDSARERYVVHCEANDHWQIKQNLDYMQ